MRKNKQSACTVNLLDTAVDYTAIDQAVTESIEANPDNDADKADGEVANAASQYTVEEQAAKSNQIIDISRLMFLRL